MSFQSYILRKIWNFYISFCYFKYSVCAFILCYTSWTETKKEVQKVINILYFKLFDVSRSFRKWLCVATKEYISILCLQNHLILGGCNILNILFLSYKDSPSYFHSKTFIWLEILNKILNDFYLYENDSCTEVVFKWSFWVPILCQSNCIYSHDFSILI